MKDQRPVLVYGDGTRVPIIGPILINKEPGLNLDPKEPLFLNEKFRSLAEVLKWVGLGIWKIEPAGKPKPKKRRKKK